jgi:hypothetical protein
MPVLPIVSVVRMLPQFTAVHSREWAKNAAHSTDMENDGHSDSPN